MRERMDFYSITKIIRDNSGVEELENVEYFHTLFFYAFEQEKYKIPEPDEGNLSRIFTGKRGISKDIVRVYQEEDNIKYLVQGVSRVLEHSIDREYIRQEIEKLLQGDKTISRVQREEMLERRERIEEFIADCLLYGMSRKWIERGIEGECKKEFVVSDYLRDCHFPGGTKVFYGRENELSEIHQRLCQETKLFLCGIGGIGKSELAKQYVKQYKGYYENIIYLRYVESLQRSIAGLNFVDDSMDMSEEERFHSHYRFFKSLGSSTLIILDNFDSTPEKDELFHEFMDMDFYLIATTRNHIEEIQECQIEEISDIKELRNIFYAYAPEAKEKEHIVDEIIEEVYRHTLTVEMAAKTMSVSCLEPEELLSALQKEGIKLSNPNKVSVTKDSRTKKDRLYGHIQTLFQLQRLSERDKEILRYMVLMPEQGISKRVFHGWMETNDYNSMNHLVEYGWVQQNEGGYISLHPFLHEVIRDYTKPAFSNCERILGGVLEDCLNYGIDLPYYRDVLNTIESIFSNIAIDDVENAVIFMGNAMDYLEKYGKVDGIRRILDIMEKYIFTNKKYKMARAVYYSYRGCIADNFLDEKAAYEQGLKTLEPIDFECAEMASNLYHNLGRAYLSKSLAGIIPNFVYLEKWKKYVEKGLQVRTKYCLPNNYNMTAQLISLAHIIAFEGDTENAKTLLKGIIEELEQFPDTKTLQAEAYAALSIIELKEVRKNQKSCGEEKWKEDVMKAKEYMESHFSEDSDKVKEMNQLVEMLENQSKKKGAVIIIGKPS